MTGVVMTVAWQAGVANGRCNDGRGKRVWQAGVANGRATGLLRVFVPQRSQ